MAEVLFTTQEYYNNNSIINANTDWQIIEPIVIMVQDTHIRDLIGNDMYEDLKTKLIADVTLATEPDYKNLLVNYIQKTVNWYVMKEVTTIFKFRFMNKGVMVKNSDNSQPADTLDLRTIMDDFQNKAERYAQVMIDYLKKNTSMFPLYANYCNSKSAYTVGIDFPGSNYNCGCL